MFKFNIQPQPDDETCGQTSLHAIYRYYGDNIELNQIINEVKRVGNGGTIAPLLGYHALKRGYQAHIYVYNLNVFDPTWFDLKGNAHLSILDKLTAQEKVNKPGRIHESSRAYQAFIKAGGKIRFQDLTVNLLKHYFKTHTPILTGLSATYLYQSMREIETSIGRLDFDDLHGHPSGHFVVLSGYDSILKKVIVADPHRENPISHDNYYQVPISRLINSIMLGVLTYDANLLIIQPNS